MGWGREGRGETGRGRGCCFFLKEEKPQTLDKAFAPKRSVHLQGAIANGLTWYLNFMV